MKKKIAIVLAAAMTMALAVPAFAHSHQVVVNKPAAEEEVAEEEEEVVETAAETEEVVVEETTEEVVAEETTEDVAEEVTEEEVVEEETAVEPIVTSPNKIKDREVVLEDGTAVTYSKVKEPKTIYNTAPSSDHPFTDVTGEEEEYARAAYALGMTIGMVRGTEFVPDTTLTMEDAITWLYRLQGGVGKDGIILAKISEANGYAQKPLTWAVGLGLVDGAVEPKAEITVKQLNDMIDKLGYTTNLVGTDATMTRAEGLKTILDSLVGSLDQINTSRTYTGVVYPI